MSDAPTPSALELRVIFGDTDQMGVVYYANYLRYFEAARAHFVRVRGGSYRAFEAAGFALPVIEAHVKYRASLRYEDLFTVEAFVSERKRVTVKFRYELRRGSELCAEGWTAHACLGKDGRPAAMPPAMLSLLDSPPTDGPPS
jgi:acyl-CoA thioester hydrolase